MPGKITKPNIEIWYMDMSQELATTLVQVLIDQGTTAGRYSYGQPLYSVSC